LVVSLTATTMPSAEPRAAAAPCTSEALQVRPGTEGIPLEAMGAGATRKGRRPQKIDRD